MFRRAMLAFLIACLAAAASATCPPPGFKTTTGFSLQDYISAPWFSVQQAVNSYQPADKLYCVRAEYRRDRNSSRILVFNQGKRGSVTGALQGTDMLLNAVVRDESNGKLAVGPSFLPESLYGPYWVVATDARPYTWAIISGGPPTLKGANGTCKTASRSFDLNGNGEGFWLFFRTPTPDAAAVMTVRDVAAQLGYDLSVLLPVRQEGCTYASFPADKAGRSSIGKLFG